jgi:prepilin-type N-terminal cleavage/methylation domain-containing protein
MGVPSRKGQADMLQKLYDSRMKAREEVDEGGFTLIELLIVIVVLAILAAAVIFGLSGISGQSAVASCNSDAKSTEVAIEAYHAQKGTWTTTPSDLTTSTGGQRYLRSFADNNGPNKEHYQLTLATTGTAPNVVGIVKVQAFDGKGNTTMAATDYDNTAPLGGTINSANPCDYVQ